LNGGITVGADVVSALTLENYRLITDLRHPCKKTLRRFKSNTNTRRYYMYSIFTYIIKPKLSNFIIRNSQQK